MSQKISFPLISTLVVYLCCIGATTGQSSVGREFAIAFPPIRANDRTGYCSIVINVRRLTVVEITSQITNDTALVRPGTPYELDVSSLSRTELGIEDRVYYITADDDISVTLSNVGYDDYGQMSATAAAPRNPTSTEFYLLMYTSTSSSSCGTTTDTASYYVVSAFEDGTEINIYRSGDYNLVDTVILNRYQSYTNITTVFELAFDMSGYYITSSKPVTLSTGNACAYYGAGEAGITWSFMPPVSALAADRHISYEIKEALYNYYTIMVLATEDNTVVSFGLNGNTINRGEKLSEEYYETYDVISCDKPCIVKQVNENYNDDGGVFSMHVSPVSAYNEFVLTSPAPTYYSWTDYVIITVPSVNYDKLVIDGVSTSYSWDCRFLLQDLYVCQAHTYISPSAGPAVIYSTDPDVTFSVVVYGQDQYGEGYGFNAGFYALNESIPITTTPSPTTPPGDDVPAYYEITQRGTFSSGDGTDFDAGCTSTYGDEMRMAAQGRIPFVNDRIGMMGLCEGKTTDEVEVVAVSSPLITDGSTGATNLLWYLAVGGSQIISSVESCAQEIAVFLADHSNWPSPILPDVSGCPSVVFDSSMFETTGSDWTCPGTSTDSLQATRVANDQLQYSILLRGEVRTETNEDITQQCLLDYNNNLLQSTVSQVARVNDILGSDLCSGTSVQLATRSATISASGREGTSFSDFALNTLGDLTFAEVSACADQVSDYLQLHDNWNKPIIPTPAGCPTLIYDPEIYLEDSQKWICL